MSRLRKVGFPAHRSRSIPPPAELTRLRSRLPFGGPVPHPKFRALLNDFVTAYSRTPNFGEFSECTELRKVGPREVVRVGREGGAVRRSDYPQKIPRKIREVRHHRRSKRLLVETLNRGNILFLFATIISTFFSNISKQSSQFLSIDSSHEI